MTLQDVLSSEVDLPGLARQGWAWWTDELAALLPADWRARLSSRPRLLAEQTPGGAWRYWRDGRPAERGPGRDEPVGLLLPPEAVLLREIPAPRMPAADLRRMLAFDIDRLSPLAPDLIHFDMAVIDRDAGDGRQRVLLGIVPRASAAVLLEAARTEGLAPAALGVRVVEGDEAPWFDFLPAALEAAGAPPPSRARRYWWAAVLGLLALNIAVLVGRDIADTQRLRALADARAPLVNAALSLRARVDAEERRRRDLIARGQRAEPLRVLDRLSQAVPAGAWVQHLEWNGQSLRIAGFKRPDIDMAAALRGSGAFINVRALTPEAAPGKTLASPFDLMADQAPGAPR